MQKVAIITVNYNGAKDTLDLLDSLKKLNTRNFDIKIIVVDNGSGDDSVKEIFKNYPRIDLVQTGNNLGFAGGYNRGLEYAQAWGADYFLIINNDTLINSPNLLIALIATAEKDPKIGLIAPKIYFAKGYEFYKDRYKKEELGRVIWYAGGSFDWNNVLSRHRGIDEVDKGRYDKTCEVDFISGCCVLIKKEVIEKVGFFDSRLFAYFEDNDFSQRVVKVGFRQYYNGSVNISHKISRTAGIGSPISDYFGIRNRLIFGMRYASLRTKQALLRQAISLLISGRPMQKKGVWDFFLGKTGAYQEIIKSNSQLIYPIKLSIVIVNYNTADLVKKLLESIYRYNLEKKLGDIEIILLDNGRLDPCEKFINNFPKVKYIQNQENAGFTRGYNRTIRYARGEHILMLNSDIEVLGNSLTDLVKAADTYHGEAVVGGRLYFPDMTNQDSCFFLPTILGAIKEYFLGIKGSYFMFFPKSSKPTRVEGMVMACFLIPRKIINNIGLLDEGTFIFFEDIEYCRRLKKNGIPIYYYPAVKFIHHHGASHKQLKEGEVYKMLVKGSLNYHGRLYYSLLYLVMLLGQKLSKVHVPVSR